MSNRVSLADVAAEAGVHVSTASLALRADPRLPEATQAKVREAAERLGYKANPLVSAWLKQVRQPERAQEGVGLAFFLGMDATPAVAQEPYYQVFIDGARAEAAALGYLVTEIRFGANAEEPLLRAVAKLRYRGVRGALLFDPGECMPPAVVRELERDFAVVVLARCGGGQRFHRVGTDVLFNVAVALDRMRTLGRRRIAFPVHTSHASKIRKDALAAYLLEQAKWPVRDRVALPEEIIEFTPAKLVSWLRRHRADALLSVNFNLYDVLLKAGYRIPEDLLFAHIGTDARPWLPGINCHGAEIGRAAVFQLAGLLTSNRLGVPELPLNTLVPGVWSDGERPLVPVVRPPKVKATASARRRRSAAA